MDDFHKRWFLVVANLESQLMEVPEALPLKRACWASSPIRGPLGEVRRRIQEVHAAGLIGQMVAKDFMKRWIAPLYRHREPMWMYAGQKDPMWLSSIPLEKDLVKEVMGILFTALSIITLKVDEAQPLHRFIVEDRLELVNKQLVFDEWG